MHINAGQIPDITKGNKDALPYLEYAVIRGFEHHLYGDLSFELYIFSQNIHIYTNTFHHSCYYKYFHITEHNIGGGGKYKGVP